MVGTFDVLGSHGMVCREVEGGGRRRRANRQLMVSQLRILDMSVILLQGFFSVQFYTKMQF